MSLHPLLVLLTARYASGLISTHSLPPRHSLLVQRAASPTSLLLSSASPDLLATVSMAVAGADSLPADASEMPGLADTFIGLYKTFLASPPVVIEKAGPYLDPLSSGGLKYPIESITLTPSGWLLVAWSISSIVRRRVRESSESSSNDEK
eukprot:2573692-Pleurochrysis_carterae.AAC.2